MQLVETCHKEVEEVEEHEEVEVHKEVVEQDGIQIWNPIVAFAQTINKTVLIVDVYRMVSLAQTAEKVKIVGTFMEIILP